MIEPEWFFSWFGSYFNVFTGLVLVTVLHHPWETQGKGQGDVVSDSQQHRRGAKRVQVMPPSRCVRCVHLLLLLARFQ
jgi:hypothetical protein